ncbi:tetraacyldisaccharide 4'-kinase [Thalassotalea atypica]|uniref:tetraacyldisaccharide 4'-kinase n=1 Tax=Thalassotalea atypica TaxID=2054316 RepID=UPI002573EA90|nr:tetraacyldisaccharide 4'-kinase [Thalassotalea atypica]
MRLIEKVWFSGHNAKWLLVPLLFPLTLLFWLLSSLRRQAYKWQLLKASCSGIPVIVVGNIGVGGNGKTPLVIHLIQICQQLGLRPGVISRGYGGKLQARQTYPLTLNQYTPVEQTGDEPFLIYHRCNVPVVVGPERISSAKQLKSLGCDIVIADDGLQHYKLKRDCEIIVVDGKRGFGNGLLLPAGPLREGQWRLSSVQHVVLNGDNKLAIDVKHQKMNLQACEIVNISTGERCHVDEFIHSHPRVNAAAGIGDPSRFFNTLRDNAFITEQVKAFVDHHHFVEKDFQSFKDDLPLLMTEKDAVKCKAFASANWWYLAVIANFSESDNQAFVDTITDIKNVKKDS